MQQNCTRVAKSRVLAVCWFRLLCRPPTVHAEQFIESEQIMQGLYLCRRETHPGSVFRPRETTLVWVSFPEKSCLLPGPALRRSRHTSSDIQIPAPGEADSWRENRELQLSTAISRSFGNTTPAKITGRHEYTEQNRTNRTIKAYPPTKVFIQRYCVLKSSWLSSIQLAASITRTRTQQQNAVELRFADW